MLNNLAGLELFLNGDASLFVVFSDFCEPTWKTDFSLTANSITHSLALRVNRSGVARKNIIS